MQLLLVGVLITLVSWVFAWGKFSPLSQYSFFPLWLGYILTINGLTLGIFKNSLLSKMRLSFIWLFIISIPLWWMFEGLNTVTQNWSYLSPVSPSSLKYFLGGSLYFSIVVPAVLSTSFLFYLLLLKVKPVNRSPSVISPLVLVLSFILGALFSLLIFIFPQLYFPLLWGGIFLLLEPINYLLGFPSLFKKIETGDWNLVIAIMAATIFTGFWWELWNFYSYPKWTYHIPQLGFFKIFEMPILGYLGYPFFGLEIYAFTNFIFGIVKKFLGMVSYVLVVFL